MDILAFGTSLPGEGGGYVQIRSDLTTLSPKRVTGVRMHGCPHRAAKRCRQRPYGARSHDSCRPATGLTLQPLALASHGPVPVLLPWLWVLVASPVDWVDPRTFSLGVSRACACDAALALGSCRIPGPLRFPWLHLSFRFVAIFLWLSSKFMSS